MNKKLTLIILFNMVCLGIFAQGQPVKFLPLKRGNVADWAPGSYENEEFFISRVPLQERFINKNSQVDPLLPPERRLFLWEKLGSPTNPYALPTSDMDYYTFNMWQYVHAHGDWYNRMVPPAAATDAAHRNGAKMLGCIIFPNTNYSKHKESVEKWLAKDPVTGDFINAEKMIDICIYYGFDGYTLNYELYSSPSGIMADLKNFLVKLHEIARQKGFHQFEIHWYNAIHNPGNIGWSHSSQLLKGTNDEWFDYNGDTVTNGFFLNYGWKNEKLESSSDVAKSFNRNPYEVYAGCNFEGGWSKKGQNRFSAMLPYSTELSFGLWMGQNGVAFNSRGTGSKIDKQLNYWKRLEVMYSGGKRNPADRPPISDETTYTQSSFHGMAAFNVAHSVIKSYPFATNFNTGNGTAQYYKGGRTHNNEWYNLAAQDIVPSWRWWISGGDNIKASFDFNHAYTGGTSLKLKGDLSAGVANNIRLFRTQLRVSNQTQLSLAYQLDTAKAVETPSCLKVAVAFYDDPESFIYLNVGNTNHKGWNTIDFDLSEHAGKTIAVLGIELESDQSVSGYQANIGQLVLTDGPVAKPEIPVNFTIERLNETYNKAGIMFKWELPGKPRYSEDIAWFDFYNITSTDTMFIGRTSSHSHYVEGIELDAATADIKVAVASVAKDGITRSDLVTTTLPKQPAPDVSFTVEKNVISPGDGLEFKPLDPTLTEWKWVIPGVLTDTVKVENPQVTFNETGFYDVTFIGSNPQGTNSVKFNDFIMVIPPRTNTIPPFEIEAKDTIVPPDQEVHFSLSETFRNNGIDLSASEKFQFPNSLITPEQALTFSTWFKIEQYPVSGEAYFLYKKYKWWTDISVSITPEGVIQLKSKELTGRNSFAPGVWNHLALVFDPANSTLVTYLNGERTSSKSKQFSFNVDDNPFIIARSFGPGMQDEMRIWNYARSKEEIRADMYRTIDASTNGLMAYWRMDELTADGKIMDELGKTHCKFNNSSPSGDDIPDLKPGTPALEGYLDPDCSLSFDWSFEGVTPATSTDESPVVTYSKPGTYDVKLTLSNRFGSEASDTATVTVMERPTGIENGEMNKEEFILAPNPTDGDVYIRRVNPGEANVTIRVVDVTGNQVCQSIRNLNPENAIRLNLQHLSSGFYLIQILDKNKLLSSKKLILKK